MQGLRGWRSVLAISGLVGFLALVAVAAAGHAPSAGANRPSAPAPTLLQDYAATLAILLVPIGVVLFVWSALLQRMYKNVPLKQSKAYPFRVAPRPLLSVGILFALLAISIHFGHPTDRPSGGGGGTAAVPGTKAPDKDQYQPQFRWLPMIVVGSLVVGIGGAMGIMALRRQRELLAATPIRETLAEVLTETLDDLRNEADPRKAVIGAYAKMERTLAARGVPRRKSEAPHEYLARIIDVVSGSAHSAQRLTRLFARARFSPHEIDLRMKEDAIDALTGLRAELQAAQ